MVLDEKQQIRARQLQLQSGYVRSLDSPDVAEKLGLTAEQRDRFKTISTEVLNPVLRYREMITALTDGQKTKWDELVGKKFEFPMAPRHRPPSAVELRVRSGQFVLGGIGGPIQVPGTPVAWTTRGPAAPFLFGAVVDELKLSAEQKAEIRSIARDDAEAIGKLDPNAETDLLAKVIAIDKTTQERLEKVLTDEQRTKLKELMHGRW